MTALCVLKLQRNHTLIYVLSIINTFTNISFIYSLDTSNILKYNYIYYTDNKRLLQNI